MRNEPIKKPLPSNYATTIWLCKSDIDITSGHQVMFKNKKQQIEYFTSPERAIKLHDDNRYIRNKSGQLKLDVKMIDIEGKYNYLIYINQSHENKYYIANIVDYQYTNERVSTIYYAIDNFQTYMFDIDYNVKSTVVRRHFTKMENEKISSLPFEDLDRGRNNITVTETMHEVTGKESYFIITLSNQITEYLSDKITRIYNSSSTSQYLGWDNQIKNKPIKPEVIESAFVFIVNSAGLEDMIKNVFNKPEHVNKLQKISYIPFDVELMSVGQNYYKQISGRDDNGGKRKLYTINNGVFSRVYNYDIFRTAKNMTRRGVKGIDTPITNSDIGDWKITSLSAIEQYFMRQPFTSLIIYDVMGNASEYDYTQIGSGLNDTLRLNVFGSLGILPNFGYNVLKREEKRYNTELSKYHNGATIGGKVTIFNDLNTKYIVPTETISIINDYLSAFLQSNQNQITQQRANVDTSFDMQVNNVNAQAQRGMAGIQNQYNNQEIQRSSDMSNHMINQTLQQNNHNLSMTGQGVNFVTNAIGNLASGNLAGGLSQAIGGATSMAVQGQQFGNTMQANSELFNNSMRANIEMANNNLEHQQNMVNSQKAQSLKNASIQSKMTIDTMNARMLDIKNKPDNIASLTGGTLINVLMDRYNIYMKVNQVHPHTMKRLSDYLAEYGMLANTFESVREILDKNKYGSYIQLSNPQVKGQIPQNALIDIKRQLENGLFIWKDIKYYRDIEKMKGV